MKQALGKMESALIITLARPTSSLAPPSVMRARSAPKLLPLDTGLALTAIGFDRSELASRPLDKILGGRIAEMFVGQELLAGSGPGRAELFFWVRDRHMGRPEIGIPPGRHSGNAN